MYLVAKLFITRNQQTDNNSIFIVMIGVIESLLDSYVVYSAFIGISIKTPN